MLASTEQFTEMVKSDGGYNYEDIDGGFGVPFGVALLYAYFPDTHQVRGMSVYQTPACKVVVTCRTIVRI